MTLQEKFDNAKRKFEILEKKLADSKKDVTLQELLDYAIKNKNKTFILSDTKLCLASQLRRKKMANYLIFEDGSKVPQSYADLTCALTSKEYRLSKVTGRQIAVGIKMLLLGCFVDTTALFMKEIK